VQQGHVALAYVTSILVDKISQLSQHKED